MSRSKEACLSFTVITTVSISSRWIKRVPKTKIRCGRGGIRGSLTEWAGQAGIRLGPVEIAEMGVAGRGMVARKRIGKRDVVVSVPADVVLQVDNYRRSSPPGDVDGVKVSKEQWKVAPWWARLATMLLMEKRKGAASILAEWIKELPKEFRTPLHWSDVELDQLGYPAVKETVERQRREYKALHRGLFGNSRVKLEEFVWSVECVRSRAFSGKCTPAAFRDRLPLILFIWILAGVSVFSGVAPLDSVVNGTGAALISIFGYDLLYPRVLTAMQGEELIRYALCPMIDMFNHRPQSSAEVSYEYFFDRFSVVGPDTDVGDEVLITYGQRSNDQLLTYFGFVVEANPQDIYVFSRSFRDLIRKHGSAFEGISSERVNKLFRAGLLERGNVFISRDRMSSNAFDIGTVEVARMLFSDTATLDKHMESNYFRKPLSEESEGQTRRFLLALVKSELTATSDRDLQFKNPKIADLQRSFCLEKKRVLEEAIAVLSPVDNEISVRS